jgi:hypothetical protein
LSDPSLIAPKLRVMVTCAISRPRPASWLAVLSLLRAESSWTLLALPRKARPIADRASTELPRDPGHLLDRLECRLLLDLSATQRNEGKKTHDDNDWSNDIARIEMKKRKRRKWQ